MWSGAKRSNDLSGQKNAPTNRSNENSHKRLDNEKPVGLIIRISLSSTLYFQIMKIIDTKQTFLTWLELASFKAINFANTYVKQKLIYEFRYELELNSSCDDRKEPQFDYYPDDDNKVINCNSLEDVAELLMRADRIPVWIDIQASKYSSAFTLLHLICAGRYTCDIDKLYYYDRGVGCFGVKSPNLPIRYKEGTLFKLEKA